MTGFLRSNRYASVLITTMLLVLIGLAVNASREDSRNQPDVVLRADERSLQASPSPSVTRPPAVQNPAASAVYNPSAPTFTVPGGVKKPPSRSPSRRTPSANPGGGTTKTTAPPSSPSATTTTPPSSGSAFAAGRIAYTLGGGLWTINPEGTDARMVAPDAFFPAWARDHSAIAFADADSPGGALYLLTPSGERQGLTTGVVDDAQPSWSPDGTRLAFARIDNTAQNDYSAIWIINRDGSGLRKIATPSPCFSRDPAWSPDGKKIAFWSSRDHCDGGPTQGSYTLYVYDIATDKTTALGDGKTNRGAPAWSPDGRTIAFSSDGDGGVGFEIVLMNADGTNVRQITNLSGDDTDPSWSPDGKKIVFRTTRDGGAIYVMNANGSDIKLLVSGAAHPSWT